MSENVVKTPTELLGTLNDVEAKNAPKSLFLRGDSELLKKGGLRISIIGSRKSSEEGLRRASILARLLAQRDIVVVSGLAAGVDTAAHQSAIAAGGRTIAVLGTPLDQTYPEQNSDLQAKIASEHLLVSQFAIGTPVKPPNFPMRNRTMALLTDATVIVEAEENSGTLYQGWEALRLGRILFLMESVVTEPNLSWPKEMVRYGAQVLSRDNLEYSLSEIPSVVTLGGGSERDAAF
jgi:DNA processing protein